ncbi:MAG: cytochrome c oxidase subunit II [Pirellulales bacterium]|nr:cytochrome c oxidase subunit II [Pirellulales bacterium]
MNRFWTITFLLVPILGVATFLIAPVYDHSLPEDYSENGEKIDGLYYFILYLTGAVFIVTEAVLFWFMWKYDAAANDEPTKFTHGSHNLEIVWTIVPAATLLFIALYQMNAWAEAKIDKPDMAPTCKVVARQFEWRIQYTGPDNQLDTPDDIYVPPNDLRVPVNEQILIHLESDDVLHSFFLPNFRVKQDAVPGSMIPVWFRATEEGEFDLVCAELCGWGHYKMKGRLTVQSREEFDAWLQRQAEEQMRDQ